MRVLSVIGTRPEAVKMAPVVAQLGRTKGIDHRLLLTAQHRDMVDQVLKIFDVIPEYDLDLMRYDQSPSEVLAAVLLQLQPALLGFAPDWLLVQGDTTTALGAAVGAAYAGIRVAHVEAGLRTYDRENPFPEELNRVLIDHASHICFAPTERARQALLSEGIPEQKVFVTGNTVVDALQFMSRRLPGTDGPSKASGRHLVLVTAHRRENHGQPLRDICKALRRLARRPDVYIVYPVHRNPNVWNPVHEQLNGIEHITLLEPVDYLGFVSLMDRAYLILTDSGGIQEEAPSLGVPVLVMRSVTERQEAVSAGVARVVGTDTQTIVSEASRLLDDPSAHAQMACADNPFGDGNAAGRIVDALCSSGPNGA